MLFTNPSPANHNSFAWAVEPVVPVEAVVPTVPLLKLLLLTSDEVGARRPEYSTTTAAARTLVRLIVTPAPDAPETTGAYHISVVLPVVDPAPDWVTLDQVAPEEVIPVTIPVVVPLVEITAIRVFPVTGVDDNVTLIADAALEPVFPVPVAPLV